MAAFACKYRYVEAEAFSHSHLICLLWIAIFDTPWPFKAWDQLFIPFAITLPMSTKTTQSKLILYSITIPQHTAHLKTEQMANVRAFAAVLGCRWELLASEPQKHPASIRK